MKKFKKKFEILFVHDHKFVRSPEGKTLSEGKFSNSVFARYRPLGRHVVVLSRMVRAETRGYVEIDLDQVSFVPVRGAHFGEIFSRHLLYNLGVILGLIRSSKVVVLRLPSILGIIAWGFSCAFRKPFFVEMAGDPYESLTNARGGRWGLKFFAKVVELATKCAVRNAKGVIYVTQSALQRKFPTTGLSAAASNVELHIDSIKLVDRSRRPALRRFKIGLIGSFCNTYKGIDVAILALSELRALGHECCLHILGSGDERFYRNLAAQAGVVELLTFDGSRPAGSGVYSWLDEMDLYIQPSRTEGLPRALIEAMSRRLACVGSSVGGIPELLAPEVLVEPGNSACLAQKLGWLLEDQVRLDYQAERNYCMAQSYSTERLGSIRRDFWLKAGELVGDEL